MAEAVPVALEEGPPAVVARMHGRDAYDAWCAAVGGVRPLFDQLPALEQEGWAAAAAAVLAEHGDAYWFSMLPDEASGQGGGQR